MRRSVTFLHYFGHKHSNKSGLESQDTQCPLNWSWVTFYFKAKAPPVFCIKFSSAHCIIFFYSQQLYEWMHLLFCCMFFPSWPVHETGGHSKVNNFMQARKWPSALKAIKLNKQWLSWLHYLQLLVLSPACWESLQASQRRWSAKHYRLESTFYNLHKIHLGWLFF